MPLQHAYCIGLTMSCGACAVGFNAAVTYAVSGSLKAAAIGAFVSLVSAAGMNPSACLGRSVIGGLASRALGGKFEHGFISAGASGIASQVQNPVGHILAAAVVGGTVSDLTGGKFANGAISAAFAMVVQTAASSSKSHQRRNAKNTFKNSNRDLSGCLCVLLFVTYTLYDTVNIR